MVSVYLQGKDAWPRQKWKKYQQWLLPHTPEQKIVNALLSGYQMHIAKPVEPS